jgi:hypothetical protein
MPRNERCLALVPPTSNVYATAANQSRAQQEPHEPFPQTICRPWISRFGSIPVGMIGWGLALILATHA